MLVRVDFNVPMQDGEVTDTTRITRVLPTVKQLANGGAKVIVLSHLGRPKGQRSPDTSLAPVAAKVAELMGGTKVHFIKDCVGDEARRGVDALKPGEVAVLENLRYHAGEEKNDVGFAKQLAEIGDLYVDDAFSSSHRAHASVEGITHLLPAYAGLLMMAEIRALDRALEHPARPVMAIAGGAKVSTKIQVLTNLTAHGPARACRRHGLDLPLCPRRGDRTSLCQPDAVPVVKEIMARAKQNELRDRASARLRGGEGAQGRCRVAGLRRGQYPARPDDPRHGAEVGCRPQAALRRDEDARLERTGRRLRVRAFGNGTFELMREAARLVRDGKLVAIAGGGDTVAALNVAGVGEDFTYVSTAGGAFLEWLEGKTLPAVAALAENRA